MKKRQNFNKLHCFLKNKNTKTDLRKEINLKRKFSIKETENDGVCGGESCSGRDQAGGGQGGGDETKEGRWSDKGKGSKIIVVSLLKGNGWNNHMYWKRL